jgi:hypothetical protein
MSDLTDSEQNAIHEAKLAAYVEAEGTYEYLTNSQYRMVDDVVDYVWNRAKAYYTAQHTEQLREEALVGCSACNHAVADHFAGGCGRCFCGRTPRTFLLELKEN